MTNHDTALEAAASVIATARKTLAPAELAELVLSAYISTLSPDVSGLVERLKTLNPWTDLDWPERIQEAADALTALSLQLAAVEERNTARKWLGEILAVIHRDGGQYQDQHGDEKAVRDAHNVIAAAQEENERLRKALEKIERWFGEFPPTGDYWPSGGEMSYAACYGSNGERDFMRGVARKALSTPSKEDKTDAE